TGTIILSIRPQSDDIVHAGHETADVAEFCPPVLAQGLEPVCLGQVQAVAPALALEELRPTVEPPPALHDVLIAPGGSPVLIHVQHDMVVVAHDSVGDYVDREN